MRACTSLLAAVFAALLLCSEVLKVLHVLVDDVGELMLVVSLQPHLETDPTRNVANASRPNKDVDRRVKANVLYLCKLLNLCADGADGDRRSLLTRLPRTALLRRIVCSYTIPITLRRTRFCRDNSDSKLNPFYKHFQRTNRQAICFAEHWPIRFTNV